jgi:hypothetical protein
VACAWRVSSLAYV